MEDITEEAMLSWRLDDKAINAQMEAVDFKNLRIWMCSEDAVGSEEGQKERKLCNSELFLIFILIFSSRRDILIGKQFSVTFFFFFC